jgi:protein-S-isoprenylcysteine O-methyltransferase Ste14
MESAAVANTRAGRAARTLSATQDVTLVALFALFGYANTIRVLDGDFSSIGFAAEMFLLGALFLVRRRSTFTSRNPLDWIVASATWLALIVYMPVDTAVWLEAAGIGVQMLGLTLTVVTMTYLGRSFGIVAADRGLKVNGPYALVRHPIYFSHTITMSGFLLANPSLLNGAFFALISAMQLLRIRAEERVLTSSTDYESYRARVRWRLVPGVY